MLEQWLRGTRSHPASSPKNGERRTLNGEKRTPSKPQGLSVS
jgi:hypothetical protein